MQEKYSQLLEYLGHDEPPFVATIDKINESYKDPSGLAGTLDFMSQRAVERSLIEKKDIVPTSNDINNIYIIYRFFKNQRRIFTFDFDLTRLFYHTELHGIHADALESPYQCVYFPMPEGIELMNPYRELIDGIFLCVDDIENMDEKLINRMSTQYKDELKNLGIESKGRITKKATVMTVSNTKNFGEVTRTIFFNDHEDLFTQLGYLEVLEKANR